MRGMLVDEEQTPCLLNEDVGVQRLADDAVIRYLGQRELLLRLFRLLWLRPGRLLALYRRLTVLPGRLPPRAGGAGTGLLPAAAAGAAGCGAGQGGSGRVTGCTGFGEASAAPSRRSVSEPICSSTVREAAGAGRPAGRPLRRGIPPADMVRKAEFPSFCGFSFICTRPEACSSAPSTP